MVMYRQKLIERRIFKLPLNLKRIYISFSHIEKHVETTLRAAEDALKRVCKLPMRFGCEGLKQCRVSVFTIASGG